MLLGRKPQYGEWVEVKQIEVMDKNGLYYNLKCKCGAYRTIKETVLSLKTPSCTKCSKNSIHRFSKGTKIGQWLILDKAKSKSGNSWHYKCQCLCGKIKITAPRVLKNNRSKRCNDCRLKILRQNMHGMQNTSTYKIWASMLRRCKDNKLKSYKWYGARGIKVCDEWHNFRNFIKDMGLRPPGLQIDRINNDGNYEPGNCRWVTPKENANNKRKPSPKLTQQLTLNFAS